MINDIELKSTSIFIYPNCSYSNNDSYSDEEYRLRKKKEKKIISVQESVLLILQNGKKYKISEISNRILKNKMCKDLNGQEQTERVIISSNTNRLAREGKIKKRRINGNIRYYL